jgi:F-type H+-transporting ATPase subunit delta
MSVARSYARAWVENLEARKESASSIEAAYLELTSLSAAIQQNRNAQIALGSPATSNQEKLDLVAALAKGLKLSASVSQLLQLLGRKDRLAILADVVEAIDEVRLEARGGVKGLAESPDPLSERDLDDLATAFGKKIGKPVRFKWKHVPTLLAGVRVTIQGTTYDGSLSAQLERIRDRLVYGRESLAN